MDNTIITQTANDVEELFKLVMKLYWSYLDTLEIYMQKIPDTETALLSELVEHMEEVQGTLEHDISVFQKALNSDMEDMQSIQDQLKIDNIHKTLTE